MQTRLAPVRGLVRRVNCTTAGQVMDALSVLELKRLMRLLPVHRFVRVWSATKGAIALCLGEIKRVITVCLHVKALCTHFNNNLFSRKSAMSPFSEQVIKTLLSSPSQVVHGCRGRCFTFEGSWLILLNKTPCRDRSGTIWDTSTSASKASTEPTHAPPRTARLRNALSRSGL
jgi:hypothetical protein